MRHTPGPWRRTVGMGVSAGTQYVAGCYHKGLSSREIDANRDLIVAAPELLAALQEFVSAFDKDLSGMWGRPLIAKLRAQKAIKKATGEEA